MSQRLEPAALCLCVAWQAPYECFFKSRTLMAVKPNIGEKGGQEYPVLRSIQTFLNQMAEGSTRPAPMVLKELLQNADDAGAPKITFILDQRTPRAGLSAEYAALCEPSFHLGPEQQSFPSRERSGRGTRRFQGHPGCCGSCSGRSGIALRHSPKEVDTTPPNWFASAHLSTLRRK